MKKDKNLLLGQCDVLTSLRSIANNHGIKKFVKVESGDEYCLANGEDAYINISMIAGNDEIYLGIYDDDELMIASFFHELGHTGGTGEIDAWLIGFKLAKQYGYDFSERAYLWAIEQLKTYANDEMRFKL